MLVSSTKLRGFVDTTLFINGVRGNLLAILPDMETKSVKLSRDGSFIAIGTQQGTLYLRFCKPMMHIGRLCF